MKKAKLEKSLGVKVKKKTGPKNGQKIIWRSLKTSAGGERQGFFVQPVSFLSNPSSLKDIGASRIKITASAAEKFEDKKSDSGESNISLESEIEDAGNNSATFAVVDRLKISSEL